jgi:hypothetical protein
MDTTELWNNLRAEALKALAKSAGLPRTITRKPELMTELNRFVTNRLPVCQQSRSAAERHLLAEAAHNQGRVKPDVFSAKYGVRTIWISAAGTTGSCMFGSTTWGPFAWA